MPTHCQLYYFLMLSQKEILHFLLRGLVVEKPNATCKRIMSDKSLLSLAITLMGNNHSLTK